MSRAMKAEDDSWEDINDDDRKERAGLVNLKPRDDMSTSRPTTPSISAKTRLVKTSTTARRRKPGPGTTFIAASPRRSYSAAQVVSPPPAKPKRPPPPVVTSEELQHAAVHGTRFAVVYVFDVVSTAIKLLKWPLTLLLLVYVFALILNQLSNSIRAVFSPLCIIPGISSNALCASSTSRSKFPSPDYPRMVEIQSNSFEQLLDESVKGSGLSLEIKKAEMATSDLITLVGMSELTSRDLLAETLRDFVQDAKTTATGLNKLNAKVIGAVDDIVAVNDYALRTLQSASFVSNSVASYIWPFSSRKSPQDVVSASFEQSMTVLSSALHRCVLEATHSMHSLDLLDQRLQTIHSIVAREDATISEAHSDLLANLWTMLGGNRKEVKSFEDRLALLRSVGQYRTRARAHVAGAIQTLDEMQAHIEELRMKAGSVELLGGRVPLEVHVQSIQSGLERLSLGRKKAQFLEKDAIRTILGSIEE